MTGTTRYDLFARGCMVKKRPKLTSQLTSINHYSPKMDQFWNIFLQRHVWKCSGRPFPQWVPQVHRPRKCHGQGGQGALSISSPALITKWVPSGGIGIGQYLVGFLGHNALDGGKIETHWGIQWIPGFWDLANTDIQKMGFHGISWDFMKLLADWW